MPTSSDHMPHLKLMRTTSRMPLCWLKGWLSKHLLDTNILKWFATKDWNFLLSNFDETYEEMVKEFYAGAIYNGDELKCWVRGKDFTVTPSYLVIILNINRPVFRKPLVYDDLDPEADLLRETFGENLEFSPNGKSISVTSVSPELRLLTTIMFHNLYPLSSTGYMNLGWALFLHDCGENCLKELPSFLLPYFKKFEAQGRSSIGN